MAISILATKQLLTAVIEEKMSKIFYRVLISCFIFTIISCGNTTEENIGSAVSKTYDTIIGGSDSQATSAGDEVPTNVVFGKTILAPGTTLSKEFEESGSDVIKTSGGDYVVVGTSVSWEWPMPDNMEDILIVKLDGTSGNVIWNKKIHLRNYDRGTSIVEDNDGNYVITGFTSINDETKSDVFFGKVDPQGNVLVKKAINISNNYDGGYSISKTADGGFVIGGEAGHHHNEDFMILKVDQNGNKEWSSKFSDHEDNAAYEAMEASDGNFLSLIHI